MIDIQDKIDALKCNEKINEILKSKNLNKIEDVISMTKTELKNLGLYTSQISEIEIKAELQGLRLKGSL